jgi:hypothetical protein
MTGRSSPRRLARFLAQGRGDFLLNATRIAPLINSRSVKKGDFQLDAVHRISGQP